MHDTSLVDDQKIAELMKEGSDLPGNNTANQSVHGLRNGLAAV